MDHVSPCVLETELFDLARLVLQSVTAVLVAWLAKRAVTRDAAERRSNGNDSAGK
jgi:hypothetical protein